MAVAPKPMELPTESVPDHLRRRFGDELPKHLPFGVHKTVVAMTKTKIGPLEFVELNAPTFVEAHKRLGELSRTEILENLDMKLSKIDDEELAKQIRFIRGSRKAMDAKLGDGRINQDIRRTLGEYFESLKAWSEGAQFYRFITERQRIGGMLVDGQKITEEDLALWLQLDTFGCQTGLLRGGDGSVKIWHSEEWPTDEVKKAQILSFKIGAGKTSEEIYAFHYPYLLPGSAFSWRPDGFAQGFDSLYLKPAFQEGASLANVAVWVSLRLGGSRSLAEVIRSLGPFSDGCAISTVRREGGRVVGERVEFAGDKINETVLPAEPGGMLFQVNLVSDPQSDLAKIYEIVDEGYRGKEGRYRDALDWRVGRMNRVLKRVKSLKGEPTTEDLRRILAFTGGPVVDGNVWSTANPDVKGQFTARISPESMGVLTWSGPATKKDAVVEFVYKTE